MIIDGIEYMKKEEAGTKAVDLDGMQYRIIRTYSAGVFAGYIESVSDCRKIVVIRNARRIWYWAGAASLSQLAANGTSKPEECKFPCEVDRIEVSEAIEHIDCTEKARLSIKGVGTWTE